MRERLIELIKESFDKPKYEFYTGGRNCAKGYVSAQTIADYLLDNGVIVLPCKPEEVVYAAHKDCRTVRVAYASVEHILADLEAGWCIGYTKEEAEAKLAELKGE